MNDQLPDPTTPSRRQFLKASTAAAVATSAAAGTIRQAKGFHAGADDLLRVGLIGCGGRGTKAAVQALNADYNVKLTAMGDMFSDRLDTSLQSLERQEKVAHKLDVPVERRFVGFNAYQQVLASGVDVVLLATPPHFRPAHLKAAIDAGIHVFAEKPVAVDAPGVRSVLQTCEEAKTKGLSVVSGLCLRYSYPFQEAAKRINDGEIGEVLTIQANDYRGGIWVKPRQPDWTDMHWQMRNWYYFTWLSGDFNVEQHVHYLDVSSWLMNNEYPISAVGLGGRQQRTGKEYGNIYDHHSVVYEFASGTKLFSNCRQIRGCKNDMSVHAVGTRGKALLVENRAGPTITNETHWLYDGERNDLYQTEHDELFAGIRKGQPINNGEYMAYSTLLAIMGRMATYTGQIVTWDMALNSQEDLTPASYDWGPIETPPIAIPGVTKFV
jgi:predicted dehydrogenase